MDADCSGGHLSADRSGRISRRIVWLAGLLLLLWLIAPATAVAATITVDVANDDLINGDGCSLREAVANANRDAAAYPECTAGAGPDLIVFNPALAGATILIDRNGILSNLVVTDTLTVDGAAAAGLALDGGGQARIFRADAPLTVANLTLTHGYAWTPVGDQDKLGGAIYATAPLTLTDTSVISNEAFYRGGGVWANSLFVANCLFEGNTGTEGGGAYVVNTATVQDSQFTRNWTGGEGGGVWAEQAVVSGSDFSDNRAADTGGGLAAAAAVTITASGFYSNSADFGGGVWARDATVTDSEFAANHGAGLYAIDYALIEASGFYSNTHGGFGGGLYTTAAVITATEFTSNVAATGGGAYVKEGAIVADSVFTANRSFSTQVFSGGGGLYAGTLDLTDCEFVTNTAAGRGGGLDVLMHAVITATRFLSNSAEIAGGGLHLSGSLARVTVTGGEFGWNTSGGVGAALYSWTGKSILLRGIRFHHNWAAQGGAVGFGSIFSEPNADRLVVTNSVFFANRSDLAGADLAAAGGYAALWGYHNTFVGTGGQGPIATLIVEGDNLPSLSLTNTIIAGYAVGFQLGEEGTPGGRVHLDGVLWSDVVSPTQWFMGDFAEKHAITGAAGFADAAAGDFHLTAASAAVDKGVDAGITTDHDGQPRPQGAAPDLGAFEAAGSAPHRKLLLPLTVRQ